MAPQHSFSGIWDSHEPDEALVPLQPIVLEDLDDDFLMIDDVEEDEVMGLLGKDGMEIDAPKLTTLQASLCDRPTTPPPRRIPQIVQVSDDYSIGRDGESMDGSYDFPRMVTPEIPRKRVLLAMDEIKVPDEFELRIQYLKSCKNLAHSMWEAEETRRRLAQQQELLEKPDKIFIKAEKLFTGVSSSLTPELEESRRKMWSMIQSKHHEDIFDDRRFFDDQKDDDEDDFFDDDEFDENEDSFDDDDDADADADSFLEDDDAMDTQDGSAKSTGSKPHAPAENEELE